MNSTIDNGSGKGMESVECLLCAWKSHAVPSGELVEHIAKEHTGLGRHWCETCGLRFYDHKRAYDHAVATGHTLTMNQTGGHDEVYKRQMLESAVELCHQAHRAKHGEGNGTAVPVREAVHTTHTTLHQPTQTIAPQEIPIFTPQPVRTSLPPVLPAPRITFETVNSAALPTTSAIHMPIDVMTIKDSLHSTSHSPFHQSDPSVIEIHNDDGDECRLCQQVFRDKDSQFDHVSQCHDEVIMKCPKGGCNFRVTDSNRLANGYLSTHLQKEHGGMSSFDEPEKKVYQEQRTRVRRELAKSVAACFPESRDETPAKRSRMV